MSCLRSEEERITNRESSSIPSAVEFNAKATELSKELLREDEESTGEGVEGEESTEGGGVKVDAALEED